MNSLSNASRNIYPDYQIILKADTPRYKFINADPEAQKNKLLEEVREVIEAWENYEADKNNDTLQALLVELIDVKVVVNTAMMQLKKDADEFSALYRTGFFPYASYVPYFECLAKAKKEVVQKNLRRGYYAEPKEEQKDE